MQKQDNQTGGQLDQTGAAMPSAEWLTVKQFATAAGCSTQAVYKRLATTLQPYAKQESGRTFINSAALDLATVDKFRAGDNLLQPGAGGGLLAAAALDALRDQIGRQAAEIERQRAELNTARGQLDQIGAELAQARAELAAQISAAADAEARRSAAQALADAAERREREQAAQLCSLADALAAAQKQAAELAQALTTSQALQAGQIQLAMQGAPHTTVRTEAEPAADAVGGDRSTRSAGAAASDSEKPRGFFARLFRR